MIARSTDTRQHNEAKTCSKHTGRTSTQDRIRARALALFNRHGAENIGCNKIAASLGISPGNLYYHFTNKEDIIRDLFDDMERAITALAPDVSTQVLPTEEQAARIYIHWMATVWQYRFIFGGLRGILYNDRELKTRFQAFQKSHQEALSAFMTLGFRFEHGAKPLPDPDLLQATGTNLWLIATTWVRHATVMDLYQPDDTTSVHAIIKQGAIQIFAGIAHNLTRNRRDSILDHIRQFDMTTLPFFPTPSTMQKQDTDI